MSKQFIFQQASLLQAPCSALQARVRSAACRFHSNLKADATPSGLKKVNTKQLKSGVVPPSLEWDTIPDPTAFQTPLYSGPHCIPDSTAFRTPLHSIPHCIPGPTAFWTPLHSGHHYCGQSLYSEQADIWDLAQLPADRGGGKRSSGLFFVYRSVANKCSC